MAEPVQIEIESNSEAESQTQEARNVKLFIGNEKPLSENFNAEIDAWARHALAANGFGDY